MNVNETINQDAADPAVESFTRNYRPAPSYAWARVRDNAGHAQWAGCFALAGAVVALVLAVVSHVTSGQAGLFYAVSGALLLLGLGLVVFAQLLFIRAAVERASEKQAQG